MVKLKDFVKEVCLNLKLFGVTCVEMELNVLVEGGELFILDMMKDNSPNHPAYVHKITIKTPIIS